MTTSQRLRMSALASTLVLTILASGCSDQGTTNTAQDSSTTSIPTSLTTDEPATTVPQPPAAQTNDGPSWVEYDACIRSQWHEAGVELPTGELLTRRTASSGVALEEALNEVRERCADWRPASYEEPSYAEWYIPRESVTLEP